MNLERFEDIDLKNSKPRPISELLSNKEVNLIEVKKIRFANLRGNELVQSVSQPILDIDGKNIAAEINDRYNESEEFIVDGQHVIAVREDKRLSEESVVRFYNENQESGDWELIEDIKEMKGFQDPSFQGEINGLNIIGMVETEKRVNEDGSTERAYWAKLFGFKDSLKNLELLATAPEKSKSLKVFKISEGHLGVLVRMQGEKYGKGKELFGQITSLDKLQPMLKDLDNQMSVIEMFDENEWGAVNDIHDLKDGTFGIIGHVAREVTDENGQIKKEYYVTASRFNPISKEIYDTKIILERSDLNLEVDAKRPDLENIIYPTNSVLDGDNLHIYAGVSDTTAVVMTVKNPWQDIVSIKNEDELNIAA